MVLAVTEQALNSPPSGPEPDWPSPHPYQRPPAGQVLPQDVWDGTDGLGVLRSLIAGDLPASPIRYLCGIAPVEAEAGRTTWTMPASEWLCAPVQGRLYGGAIAMLAGTAIDPVDMRDMFDLLDGRLQPGTVQTVSVEIPANVGEVALGGVEMAAIASRPTLTMLDVTQIFLCPIDDTMGTRPIALLRWSWTPSRQKQTGECEIRQYMASHVYPPPPSMTASQPDLFQHSLLDINHYRI